MNEKLLNLILKSKGLVDSNFDEAAYRAAVEAKMEKDAVVEATKADEVMHTTNTGFGEELIPTNVYMDPMLDLVPTYSSLMNMLPGNHGNNMPISAKVPVMGEADMFKGNTEWTTGTPVGPDPVDNGPATAEVTIVQGQYILTVSLSKRELNYSPENLTSLVRERINKSAARVLDATFINADDATTGNVNTSATPATDVYYVQQDGGIRDIAIGAGNVHNVSTLDEGDFIEMLNKLAPGYQSDLNNLLFLMPSNVYNKALLLDAVLTVDKFGPAASFKTGVLAKAFGIDITIPRDRPALALATGKVDGTTGDVFGSLGLLYKPAVQYGFGQPLEIDVYKVPGKGVQLIATFEFGFNIAYNKANLGATIAMGVNVTM